MEQPPGYVAQGETKICRLKKAICELNRVQGRDLRSSVLPFLVLAFRRCHSNHSVFVQRIRSGIIVLTVYVDDILLTGSDSAEIVEIKMYLKRSFMTKDMGTSKILLGIEVAHQEYSVLLFQRKYALNILEETDFLRCKPANTPMEANVDL